MSVIYIHTQGACLRRNGGRFVVTKGDEELTSTPQAAVDGVVILGNVQVTSQAVAELMDEGVPVIYLSMNGRFRGILQPGFPKNVFVRLAQYEASNDKSFRLESARHIVSSKLVSMETAQARWRRNGWSADNRGSRAMDRLKQRIQSATEVDSLRGLEGRASRMHFTLLGSALPPDWNWRGRNRQPPRDPVNAMLSLAYMMTTGECVAACYAAGLDPFIGILHELDYSRPSLALDLLEPLRPAWCDHFVLRCIQKEDIQSTDFTYDNSRGCRLESAGFRRFIEAFDSMAGGFGSESGLRGMAATLARETARAFKERTPPVWTACTGGQ